MKSASPPPRPPLPSTLRSYTDHFCPGLPLSPPRTWGLRASHHQRNSPTRSRPVCLRCLPPGLTHGGHVAKAGSLHEGPQPSIQAVILAAEACDRLHSALPILPGL